MMAYTVQKYNALGQSALDWTQTISSVLNPLIQTGANIFMMSEQAKLQEDILKHQQNIPQPIMVQPTTMSQQNIIIIVGVIAVLVLLMIVMSSKGSKSSSGDVVATSGVSSGSSPQIIKKIVRRRLPTN